MLTLQGVEMSATHTLERNVTALGFKARVIPAIVIDPQTEKKAGNEQAVNQSGDDDIHLLGKECRRR
jgi:hypothetical protein